MIKEIKIYPRFVMDNFALTGGLKFPYHDCLWDLISIYGDGEGPLLTPANEKIFKEIGMRHSISLNFWDITDRENYPNGILFNRTQAKQIVEMIKKIQKEKEDSILIVHCSAGISRSGAVGTFACDFCGLDYNKFIEENKCIMANPHVLRLLRKEAEMIPDFGTHDGVDKSEETGGIIIPPWVEVEEKK
jgi:hypothetical protein